MKKHVATIVGCALVFAWLTVLYCNSFSLTSDATVLIDDGIEYARIMESGGPLFHPHHLLYHWIGELLWNIQKRASAPATIRAVVSLQFFSSLCGAAGIIAFFFLLKRFTFKPLLAACIAVGLGLSRGYWFFSASAETIIPGAVPSIFFFYFLFLIFEGPRTSLFFWLAIVTACGMMVRQDNFLLMLVVLICLPFLEKGKRFRWSITYAATTCIIAGGAQLVCYRLSAPEAFSWSGFLFWSTQRAHYSHWCSLYNLRFPGLKIAFWRFIHALGYGTVNQLDRIRPESLTKGIVSASMVTNAFMIVLSIIAVLTLMPALRAAVRKYRLHFLACLSWVAIREIFLTWYVPEYIMAFSVGSLIPIAILMGLWFSEALDRGMPRIGIATLMAGLTFCSVLSGILTIIPFSRPTFYADLERFERFTEPGDMIFVREMYHYPLLTYLGKRQVAILDYYYDEDFRSLDKQRIIPMMQRTFSEGKRVYLIPSGDSPFHPAKEHLEREFFRSYVLTPVRLDEMGRTRIAAWEVHPPRHPSIFNKAISPLQPSAPRNNRIWNMF